MATGSKILNGVHVLLGVSGGVAAYKAVDLASKLAATGALVKTIMTQNACEFVLPKSFEAVTASPVFTSMWNGPEDFRIGHIDLATQADIIVIAPATANIISKIANGICDDLLSTTMCACWDKPVVIAPAMNDKMWANPAVQKNLSTIKDMGFKIVGPEKGRLACGTEGLGRMSEAETILEALKNYISQIKKDCSE